jgi:hypothetical protein
LLENLINKTLLGQTSALVRKSYSGEGKIVIDITKIPIYSKSKSRYITHGNTKRGTTSFYQFLGFFIIERQFKFPVSFHLMKNGDSIHISKFVDVKLVQIKEKIKIKLIIMDRVFISCKIVRILQRLECSFMIAFRKSKKFNHHLKLD